MTSGLDLSLAEENTSKAKKPAADKSGGKAQDAGPKAAGGKDAAAKAAKACRGRAKESDGKEAKEAKAKEESLVERTLGNLAGVWRDIAFGAARTMGLTRIALAGGDQSSIKGLMSECLQARGGEVSARMRAAELGKTYIELDKTGRAKFLEVLARSFAIDEVSVDKAIDTYRAATDDDSRLRAGAGLRRALEPPHLRLLRQFNDLPEGVRFLVDLRADLLALRSDDPHMIALDRDLKDLLTSWFDVGFLDLRLITWDSPASLLEKLIAYEAVHQIQSWADMRNRLDSHRRCYALFHPRMPNEPLAFVEVALVRGLAAKVQDLLEEKAPDGEPLKVDTAIFYSITNTQRGLNGVSFGEYLIKRVVSNLTKELPGLKTFATLSPVPGFRGWLRKQDADFLSQFFSEEEQGGLRALGGSDELPAALEGVLDKSAWPTDPVVVKALKGPLMALCARYLVSPRADGQPLDSVARFHLRNGARLERLNWLGDVSENGLMRSAGMMVNYLYVRGDIEKNHEAYMTDGKIVMGSDIKPLVRSERGSESPLKKLGFG